MLTEAQEARSDAGATVGRVGVTRLVLTDFRNYREARLSFGTEPLVVTGPNGAGKTNLLEAVSLLAADRQSDAQAGGALIGPHRSDLSVSLAEKGLPAGLASTGEQKAVLISILLAQTRLQTVV